MEAINTKIDTHFRLENKDALLKGLVTFLKPKEVEKKKFGEVFTPPKLVEEMLSKLEESVPDIFSHPEYKWLDPANGIGNFPICLFYRLMKGLDEMIPDKQKRKRHILEQMIYVCELNPVNNLIYSQIMEGEEDYKLNIYEGDFLAMQKNKPEWKDFDCIIGNPPYNKNNTGTGSSLWDKFVVCSLSLLRELGFMILIHPPVWRKPASPRSRFRDLSKTMTCENQMLYLEIHNAQDGIKTFQSGTRYDWYIINKKKADKPTTIKDETGFIHTYTLSGSWIPNYNMSIINRFLATESDAKVQVISKFDHTISKHVSLVQTSDFKYPLVHSIPQSGTRIMYSDRQDKEMFGVSKVIIGESGIHDVIIDLKGEYGMTQCAFAIRVDSEEEALAVKRCLLSSEFQRSILTPCVWSSFRIDWRMFVSFKKNFWNEFTSGEQISRTKKRKKETPVYQDQTSFETQKFHQKEIEDEHHALNQPSEKKFNSEQCMTYTVDQLVSFCRSFGLDTRGTKQTLCTRLNKYEMDEPNQNVKEQKIVNESGAESIPEVHPTPPFNIDRCMLYSKLQLKEFCRVYNVNMGGNKTELCSRLLDMVKTENKGKDIRVRNDICGAFPVIKTLPLLTVEERKQESVPVKPPPRLYTIKDLKQLLKDHRIKGITGKNKTQLIDMCIQHHLVDHVNRNVTSII